MIGNEKNSPLFQDIYNNEDDFIKDFGNYGYQEAIDEILTEKDLKFIFLLLFTRYQASEIISFLNIDGWKMKLQYLILTYGSEWKTKNEIQKEINNIKDEDLKRGSVNITNSAFNPATEPTATTIDELTYINNQIQNIQKRDKLSRLILKYSSVASNVNDQFLNHFETLFSRFTTADKPFYIYKSKSKKYY